MTGLEKKSPTEALLNNKANEKPSYIAVLFLITLIAWLLWPAQKTISPPQKLPAGWKHFCAGDQVRALVRDGEKIWIGGLSGLKSISWASQRLTQEKTPASFSELVRIETMLLDASDTLWIGHEMGLYSRDNFGSWTNHTSFLPDPKVLSLCFTKSNQLWVGTWRGVAVRNPSGEWRHILVQDGLPAEQVRIIFEDSKGGMWIGTSSSPAGGLVRWSNADKTYYTTENLLAHPNVTAMMEDRSGNLWIGTGFFDKGGVTLFPDWKTNDLRTVKKMNQKTGLAGNKGRSLFEDRQNNIWIGSELDGLTKIDSNGNMDILNLADGLIGDEVMCMLQDPVGNLWLGQEKGLCLIASQDVELPISPEEKN